jgi:hypothetical protein
MNQSNDTTAYLQKQIDALRAEVYSNNFKTSQDFNKYSRFNTRVKLPTTTADPTIGDVGDVVVVSGKLKVCTVASLTAPTWVIVGTQS